MAPPISRGADGFFRRGDAHFVPVGVNYRPADAASVDQLRADLAAIAALGLNAVRVRSMEERAALERVDDHGLALFCDQAELAGEVEMLEFSARPGTHALGFDGLTDPFFHTFLPFAVRCARLRRPTVVVSLGVGAVLGAPVQDAWLQAALPAARAAGVAGLFWRELRGPDGLLGADGRMQPGREAFGACAAGAAEAAYPGPSDESAAVGLFVPAGAGVGDECERRLLLAQYFLGVIGRPARLVARATDCRKLLVAGVPIAAEEAARLHAWVAGGGELYWHGPDPLAWNDTMSALLGARPVDWRSGRGISVQAFGERFTLAHFPHDVRAELESSGASVLAHDQQNRPVLLENRVGRGRVRYALPIVEEAIVPVAAHPPARDRWAAWYRGMLAS